MEIEVHDLLKIFTMLAAVKIKEEPLDEAENSQEIFKQEEALLNQQINGELRVFIYEVHKGGFYCISMKNCEFTAFLQILLNMLIISR